MYWQAQPGPDLMLDWELECLKIDKKYSQEDLRDQKVRHRDHNCIGRCQVRLQKKNTPQPDLLLELALEVEASAPPFSYLDRNYQTC